MLRKFLKVTGRTLLSLVILLILGGLVATGYLFFTRPHSPQFKDIDGRTIPESIAVLEEIELGARRLAQVRHLLAG